MTNTFNEIIIKFNKFVDYLQQKEIAYSSYPNPYYKDQMYYEIPYQDEMANFFNDISGVPTPFINQFVNLHKFSTLITNLDDNLSLFITVYEDSFEMRLGNNNRLHNLFCFKAFITRPDYITCTYRQVEITNEFSYDDAYHYILKEVNKKISTEIKTSLQFLERYNKPIEVVIKEKLEASKHKYIDHDTFCEMNNIDKKENIIHVQKETFQQFLKDGFASETYHKLLQIISLSEFDAYISNKSITTPIIISFPTVSKFTEFNTLVSFLYLEFGLLFHDDGTFYYANDILDIPVYLEDLDEIYNHLLKELVNKITKVIDTPLNDWTIRDMEMYKIMVY